MIKTVRPQAVLYAINWLKYLHPGGAASDPVHESPPCCSDYGDTCQQQSIKDVQDILTGFSVELSQLVAEGIRVFVTTVHPEGDAFDPKTMSSVIKCSDPSG
ncbi:Aste57867_7598 [Aphanomyces stellatus]|uniref:Aste57867_7598 protein n=1 Tax=Aphanomyces stellatus TaxID=120398 RepID=A0A485KIK8_9STRA|nr:hypothetical protein As57867_007571 [Aphanomyces stellatus]VFT84506.1 Aste57867_7598 [Aphanomyces stellatus]